MNFAMFFMADTPTDHRGCVATLLFLGGWTSLFGEYLPELQNWFVHALSLFSGSC
jgi:NADH:ubiquinone oxidoreductase subunit H